MIALPLSEVVVGISEDNMCNLICKFLTNSIVTPFDLIFEITKYIVPQKFSLSERRDL